MSLKSPTTKQFLSSNDPEVEREFFARIALPNGTVKTTYAHRLDDLNACAMPFMPQNANILDVAVSSGVSTAEWCDSLHSSGLRFSMTATDIGISADLFTFRAIPNIAVLADSSGNVLHLDIFGEGWPPHTHIKPLHPLTIRTRAIKGCFRAARALNGLTMKREKVSLLTKSLSGVSTGEDDLLKGNPPDFIRAFDVIRAANIINLAYFPVGTLRRIIANLKERLKPSGILIVCRTDSKGLNNGSIFKLASDSFSVVGRIGSGSEVEHLITE